MLNYQVYAHPTSKEWVTFVHGAGGSLSVWFKQVKAFSSSFNVLLLDLRGHGKSEGKEIKTEAYTFEQIGTDVIKLLDELKIEKSHFVGISLGTIVIRELAERYPERIKSMTLGGAVMKLNIKSRILVKFGNLIKSMVPYMFLYKLYALILLPKRNHKESRLLFIREARRLARKEFMKWFGMTAELGPLLRLFREKETGIPTLYIMGEEDHMFLPSVRKLVDKHSTSSLQVIPACGHVVNVEKPVDFNLIAVEFIKNNH